MIRLTEITEDNWLEAAGLNVSGKQKNLSHRLLASSPGDMFTVTVMLRSS